MGGLNIGNLKGPFNGANGGTPKSSLHRQQDADAYSNEMTRERKAEKEAEHAKVMKAAGYTMKGGRWV